MFNQRQQNREEKGTAGEKIGEREKAEEGEKKSVRRQQNDQCDVFE